MTYPYFCPKCDHHWDNVHSVADRNKEKCPMCHKKAKRDFGQVKPLIGNWDNMYPITIKDLGPRPEDVHTVRSKKQHKDLFKKYGMTSPAFDGGN